MRVDSEKLVINYIGEVQQEFFLLLALLFPRFAIYSSVCSLMHFCHYQFYYRSQGLF